MTILTEAVEKRRVEDVKYYLHHGFSPNGTDSFGNTPLMVLLSKGYADSDLDYQAYFSQVRRPYNSNNDSPSSVNESPKKVETPFDKLFALLLPVTDLSVVNKFDETALSIAILHKQELSDQVKQLVEAGADISRKNKQEETILHQFVNRSGADKKIEVLQALTRYANTTLINAADKYGVTALDYAAMNNNYKCVEHLLYKGAILSKYALEIANETNYGPLKEAVEHLLFREEILPHIEPHDVEVLFGVELEICVKLTPECAQMPATVRLKSTDFQEKKWDRLFSLFGQKILKKSHLAETMKKRYDYMYVSGGEKYGANFKLNLSTFLLEPMPESQTIGYDKPFFTIDRSVVCADYRVKVGHRNRRENYMPAIEETFHIELVSPILTKLDELQELLEFIGMKNPSCFVANDTAGFHVNVSLRNKKTGKPIPLTSDFFTRTFFPKYKVWEADVYPQVRHEIDTYYAKCIGGTDAEKYPELYHEICQNKYVSLHRKEPRELVEFRLFGSTSNMSDLLKYTEMATEFMRSTYLEWYEFYRPSAATLKKIAASIRRKKELALKETAANILKKEQQLQKTLRNIQSRIRTHKTKTLVGQRNSIRKNLRTLKSLKEKNAAMRRTVLKKLSEHRTPISGRSKRSKSPSSKTKKHRKHRK